MKRGGRGDGGRKAREEKALRRRSRHRPPKTRILIVCEGRETEPNYFRGLRDEEVVRQNFSVVVQKGKGGSSRAVVEQVIAELNKAAARDEAFDEAWCVFDVEHPDKREQVLAARTLAKDHGIHFAISNPSFECWLLAHFVRTKKSFADCDKVIEELNKRWQREFQHDYAKNDGQIYARLADRTRTATENARQVREQDWGSSLEIVDCNSATDVYVLVERLLGSAEGAG